jgi:hypothetical protein
MSTQRQENALFNLLFYNDFFGNSEFPFLSAINKATSFLVAFFMAEIKGGFEPRFEKKAGQPFLTRMLLPRL